MVCPCGAPLPEVHVEPDYPVYCPRCAGTELAYTPNDPKHYGHHCPSCGGLFVSARDWTELLANASTVEAAIIDTTEAAPLSKTQLFPLANCPACRTEMERATFAARSGICVDVCIVHGIWFDAGELFETIRWLSEGSPLTLPENPIVELRLRARVLPMPPPPIERHDIYQRLLGAGALLTLRRLFPWR